MYKAIDRKPTVRQIYVDELVKLGQISREQAEAIRRGRKMLRKRMEREGF